MQTLGSKEAVRPTATPQLTIGGAAWLVPARSTQIEQLDLGEGSLDDARANLGEMWHINRVFGGVTALTTHLFPLLQRHSDTIRIVDVGAGAGGLATLIHKWAERRSMDVNVLLLDLAYRNLVLAGRQTRAFPHIQADSLNLPFAPNAIDLFISTLFLHHLEPEQVVAFLADSYRRARRGIVMSDITRGYLPMTAFWLVSPLFARHPLTYHDGLLSVRRAYTPAELATLAQAAGIPHARVHQHFPWRMTLVAEKPDV